MTDDRMHDDRMPDDRMVDNRTTLSSTPPDAPEPPAPVRELRDEGYDRDGYVDNGRTVADESVTPDETVEPAAPVAPTRVDARDTSAPVTEVASPQDRVRWGPVWAGLFTALMVFLVLELLAYGLGLLTVTTSAGVTASNASPWISGVLGLIAFFVGGFLAERSSAARGGTAGLLNGFMVWALGTGLILVLSLLGLGSLFGALGSAVGQIATPGNVSPTRVAELSQSVALGAFFSLVISAIAAALGGMLGSAGSATGRLTGRLIDWR